MSTPKWGRIDAGYFVDPMDIIAAQRAQSAATVGGKVAPFQLYRSKRGPVEECHNLPESEPRVRGYVDGQVEHVSNAYKLEDV